MLASELRDILVRTVKELRPILRTVFVLRNVGLSIEQTGEVLNLSQAAVNARVWRVRLHLRERLNRYFDERTTLTPEELAPTNRMTKKIIGLFAECLRDSIPQSYSVSVARQHNPSPNTHRARLAGNRLNSYRVVWRPP